jgi:Flp pilus assembly CpaE family ATPase
LVLTPDIPALRLLHASLQVLSEAGNAADRSIFVVNQVYPKPMIGPDQIEEHLGIRIGADIPYDGEGFVKAVNEGQPLVGSARRSAPAVAIRRLAEQLSEIGSSEAEVAAPQRRGLLRGILGR